MWWIGLLAAAAQPEAAPIYLACEINSGSPEHVDLALNEESQKASISRNGSQVFNYAALFDPDTVRFRENIGGDGIDWTISRLDLSVRQTATFSAHVQTGTCKIKPAPTKRAF